MRRAFFLVAVMAGTALAVSPFVANLTAQGPQPASVSIDLTGEWGQRVHEDQPERGPGPELGDYLGLPINDAARLHGDTWDASLLTLPEHQCMPHPSTYALRGPQNVRIWKEVDPNTQDLYRVPNARLVDGTRTVHLHGRPSTSARLRGAYLSGLLDRNLRRQYADDLHRPHQRGLEYRRNGIHHSDEATMVEHWFRHGNVLTVATIVTDPVYLTEPMIRTSNWEWAPNQNVGSYPCNPFQIVVEVERPIGTVPSHLPGTNAFLHEFADTHHIPFEADPRRRGNDVSGVPAQTAADDGRGAEEVALPVNRSSLREAPPPGRCTALAGAFHVRVDFVFTAMRNHLLKEARAAKRY